METQSQEPEATRSLRVQMLEIDLRVAEVKNEEYHRLLLSLAGEGAAATSVRPASPSRRSQLRADGRGLTGTQTSSLETSRDLSQSRSQSQSQPSSSSPARRERSIRASRREVTLEIPSIPRPSYARFSNPSLLSLTLSHGILCREVAGRQWISRKRPIPVTKNQGTQIATSQHYPSPLVAHTKPRPLAP
jgi:hypothetical protein